LGMTLNNQNCMHEETKGRLNSENACGHSVQIIGSSLLWPKSKLMRTATYRSMIVHGPINGCKTSFLIVREEHRFEGVGA
jgi:hypothetical protein